MSTRRRRPSPLLATLLALCGAACSSPGQGGPSGAAGTASTGAAGATSSGAAGTTTLTGAAGASVGAAGTSATGAAGTASNTGGAGTNAASGAAGTNAAAGTSGQAGGPGPDGGAPPDGGGAGSPSHGNKVLIYTKSTGFVHGSTTVAAAQIARAAMNAGLVAETSADATKFTPAGLAPYAGIVLIATAGEPFGSPGTTQVQALLDWVRAGGGLVGIENCNHAYDNNADYVALMGGDFNGHSAGDDTCVKEGVHPSTMHLTDSFHVNDEIYYFTKFRMDNVIVLRCGADKRPISWVRNEGMGRFFYTALGHEDQAWTNPPLVDGHVLPGLLWALGRTVP